MAKATHAHHALRNVNLTINDGDVFGIIGASGAGKSTLVRCLNLLERPTDGRHPLRRPRYHGPVRSCAARAAQPGGHDLPELQPVPAAHRLAQRHLPARACAARRARRPASAPWSCSSWWAWPTLPSATPASSPAASSSAWPSPARWPTTPRSCSATRPPAPLTRAPPPLSCSFCRTSTASLGVTLVVITHSLPVACKICNRVAVIDHGRIVEEGATAAVFGNPQSPVTRELSCQRRPGHGNRTR